MRIAITGASGFIGQELVPLLLADEHELLLIGRSREKLEKLYPGHRTANYQDLTTGLKGYDAIVHLAALVRDTEADLAAYEDANVSLIRKVAEAAQAAGVPVLINPETFGAHDNNYSATKEQARQLLVQYPALHVVGLRLPAVYGRRFEGRLRPLNDVPGFLRPLAFRMLSSLRCTVHIRLIAQAVSSYACATASARITVTDAQMGNWFYDGVRRIIDICFVVCVVVLFFWLLIAVWLAVRLTSDGPGLFAQQRVGKNGKMFTLYKFRTMAKQTRQAGSHELSTACLTPIGGFLRRTKIDELPQIWNILRGEISLIGPRPCLTGQTQLIAERQARQVLRILPGITGYAQVQGIDMSDPSLLARVDEEYLKLRTLPLDFKILLATFLGKGNGDRVAR